MSYLLIVALLFSNDAFAGIKHNNNSLNYSLIKLECVTELDENHIYSEFKKLNVSNLPTNVRKQIALYLIDSIVLKCLDEKIK